MQALSFPTWVIHVSSVIEWIAAILLIWRYAQLRRDRVWYGLSFAMLPALVSAMCACTWHFFENADSLRGLVTLQAAMTVAGNCTLCLAAGWIWYAARVTRNTTVKPPTAVEVKR
jgi:chromate transport protein ChrA